jgi:hypothetical protein
MLNRDRPSAEGAKSLPETFFRWFLMLPLAAGLILILGSALLRSAKAGEYAIDLPRDIGIGLIVSVLVVVFIEWRAGQTLRTEIASDVLEAVFRRTIPDIIFSQVRDCVFRSDVLRRNWEVSLTVLPPSEYAEIYRAVREAAGSSEVFLIESQVNYDLENLNDNDIAFSLTHGVDSELVDSDRGIPGFRELQFGDELHRFDPDDLRTLYRDRKPQIEPTISLSFAGPTEVLVSKQLRLPRKGCVSARYRAVRAVRVPGIYVISCATPADGIRVKATGPSNLGFDVKPLHPQAAHIKAEGTGRWSFDYGMLPWQGIQILMYAESQRPQAF